VRIRQLENAEVKLRPATTDARTTFATFWHQFHLPPRELAMPKHPIILDLGANNGLTVAHFASLYPTARIIGVELDERNVSIARINVATWADRCKIIHAGVWFEDGEVNYMYSEGSEDGLAINEVHPQGGSTETVRACSMATILKEVGDFSVIDYVKMDIEGAEREVLSKNAEWLGRVRCIKVELHGEYTFDDCIADLLVYGISARRDTKHNLCVIGLNCNLI
jgi:FkbM family methyltransferase